MATEMTRKNSGKRGWMMLAAADVAAMIAIFAAARVMLPELGTTSSMWMAFLGAQVLVAFGLLVAGIGEAIRETVNRDREINDMNPANEA